MRISVVTLLTKKGETYTGISLIMGGFVIVCKSKPREDEIGLLIWLLYIWNEDRGERGRALAEDVEQAEDR